MDYIQQDLRIGWENADSSILKNCRNVEIDEHKAFLKVAKESSCCNQYSSLQMILGHSNISMTMDLYVHVTEDEKEKELKNVEHVLKMV